MLPERRIDKTVQFVNPDHEVPICGSVRADRRGVIPYADVFVRRRVAFYLEDGGACGEDLG
ncbi:hypothetical protein Abr02nite_79000 [Paractinoplanes brasiliensis]|nr:hypothetical protein Abr02nite_79000 [Actinoplanes brasiliensis]